MKVREMLQQNGSSPLFLPEGSIRSIVTLLLVVAFIGGAYLVMLKGLEPVDGLERALFLALGFYFGQKVAPTAQK